MLRYMKENKKLFITYVLLVPASSVSSAMFSMCLEPLLNVVYSGNRAEFVKYALLACLCSLLDMLTSYWHKSCREKLRVYYVAGLKRDLFHNLLKRSIPEFNQTSVSAYISIINRDVAKMNECYFDSICGFYRVTVCFIINFVLIMYLNPVVAILNVFMSILSLFIPGFFEKKLQEKQKASSENSEEYYGLLNDYLKGFSTIKLFHIQNIIKERIEKSNRKLENSNYDSTITNYTIAWISMFCSQLSFVFTTILGIYFCLRGWMSVGAVVAISQLIGGIVVPIEELPEHISNYKSIKEIRQKIENIINTECSSQKVLDHFIECKTCDIRMNQVHFSYNEKEPFIQDISLELKAGKKYILVGGSGCGKSTLAKLLMGFYPCSTGTITLDGRKITEYSEEEFYKKVSYLEQSIFLFDDTLLNNITLYGTYSDSEIQRAIKLSGLEDLVKKLPNGLNTMIRGNGENFSGGEKQRIGIARAFIKGAEFLILDEVTASLDPLLVNEIENTVMDACDTGVLLITHKWSEALFRKADNIFVMQKGELVEQGRFDELIDRKQQFYRYYYSLNE